MAGYYAGGIRDSSTAWEDEGAGVLRAKAILAATQPMQRQREEQLLARLGFKIGLLVQEGQDIVSFEASGRPGREDRRVSEDLASVFGTPAGSVWRGIVLESVPVPSYPPEAPNVAEFTLELVLRGVRELPQLIPAPVRYGNEASFAESHLSALWVLRPPRSYASRS